ncbi:uncharacterized protein ACBT57_024781 [Dama dama]
MLQEEDMAKDKETHSPEKSHSGKDKARRAHGRERSDWAHRARPARQEPAAEPEGGGSCFPSKSGGLLREHTGKAGRRAGSAVVSAAVLALGAGTGFRGPCKRWRAGLGGVGRGAGRRAPGLGGRCRNAAADGGCGSEGRAERHWESSEHRMAGFLLPLREAHVLGSGRRAVADLCDPFLFLGTGLPALENRDLCFSA